MIMRILLIMIVPVLSIILSLMSSGIENILTAQNEKWKTIPIYYWLIFWSMLLYFVYRVKFSTTAKLKIAVFRMILKIRESYLSMKIIEKNDELNPMQKKAIENWMVLLKDKKSELISCVYTNRRMIKNNDVTFIISTADDINLIFVKTGKTPAYFDVWLPQSQIVQMFNSFDKEQKLRFQKVVDEARSTMSVIV
jgi:hypothetical protein